MSATAEAMGVKGTFRLQIVEDTADGLPRVVGDSGWIQNQITNEGFRYFIGAAMGGISGSSQVTHMALGTGGTPASNATSLTGEVVVRAAVTAATSSNSRGVVFTATFASANSFVTNTQNISNMGLFATSTAGGGTLACGAAFASSSCATNQTVNATYNITFS